MMAFDLGVTLLVAEATVASALNQSLSLDGTRKISFGRNGAHLHNYSTGGRVPVPHLLTPAAAKVEPPAYR